MPECNNIVYQFHMLYLDEIHLHMLIYHHYQYIDYWYITEHNLLVNHNGAFGSQCFHSQGLGFFFVVCGKLKLFVA